MAKAKPGTHMCEIFFCNKTKERYCCCYCEYKKKCKNSCMNNPEVCEKHFIQE